MAETDMAKAYEPASTEARWYPLWESRGYFAADHSDSRQPYTIVIPPPNVTGVLTLGHILNNTLQDILIRWEKMRGRNACWVPGTDHAGIATQARVEAMLLEKEQVTRDQLGRDRFVERVWQWKEQYGGTIIRQLRRLGCACDWRRERFTLDPGLSAAVLEVFVRLYEKGYIYRGTRLINWCPRSRTALSDEEVIYQEDQGHLWYLRYPLADGTGHVTVATTRPETMLGDTAVAVHPADPRYQALVGRMLKLPLTEREIPIIADDWVKPEFGTGAVKVTPAHDPNDYEIALRHNLPMINILNDDATMNDAAGEEYVGLDRFECREAVIEELQELKLIEKIEDYTHEVGYSERGHVPVEPRISTQWFVKMDELVKPALAAVEEGRIRFYPEHWVKTYRHWMLNIKDWCISRQLWWGHRIPAWYGPGGTVFVARSADEAAAKARTHYGHAVELTQDADVLDTWFSSWLWPFTVFGWPQEGADLRRFYPTQTLITGPDIIFFWVARMIMAGYEFMGELPFRDVFFTSIIRDELGRKLSKSLNNSPDPLLVIEKYGADALRYTMVYLAPTGTDIRYSNEKCELGRNFANKLWNAARFRRLQGPVSPQRDRRRWVGPASRQLQGLVGPEWDDLDGLHAAALRPDDRWLLDRLDRAIDEVTGTLERFDFHAYGLCLYEFVWNGFCDWYVESAKAAFHGDDAARKVAVLRVFDYAFARLLRLMHPVMPFVTEELYHQLGYVPEADSIMHATWPQALTPEARARLGLSPEFSALIEEKFALVRAGRTLKRNYNIQDARRVPFFVKPLDEAFAAMLRSDPESFRVLLNAETITVDPAYTPGNATPCGVGKHGHVYLPLAGVIDVAEELARLGKQRDEFARVLQQIDGKLANEKFVAKAPADVVARERARRTEFAGKLEQVAQLVRDLGGQ